MVRDLRQPGMNMENIWKNMGKHLVDLVHVIWHSRCPAAKIGRCLTGTNMAGCCGSTRKQAAVAVGRSRCSEKDDPKNMPSAPAEDGLFQLYHSHTKKRCFGDDKLWDFSNIMTDLREMASSEANLHDVSSVHPGTPPSPELKWLSQG